MWQPEGMALRFEVLGFAGAAPLQGGCPAYLLQDEQTAVLLDCGPGTLERLWRRGALDRVDAIVISHMHADHIADLLFYAGEMVRRVLTRRPALYVPAPGGRDLLVRLDAVFARDEQAPSRFDEAFELMEYRADDKLSIGGLTFDFAPTAHAQPCFAVRVTNGSTTIVYGADGSPAQAGLALAAKSDLLVLEATFVDEETEAAAHGHMTAAQAGELAARAGATRLLLTHTIAGTPEQALLDAARRGFPGEVELAHEGWTFPA